MASVLFSLAIGSYATLALAGSDACLDLRNNPTVTIDSGPVMGLVTPIPNSDVKVEKYLGIPFAKPPPRFSPPEPIEAWAPATLNATEHGPYCYENYLKDETYQSVKYLFPRPPGVEDEDCLNINVWTQTSKPKELKPVMLWMFGGSFQYGTGSSPLYDGTNFAANQDVVLVTYNYRTNVFGFPNAPEIPDDDVNLGFLDSRLALDWVRRNIKSFGGDPEKVTIFGNSAGAGIVDSLILAPPDPLPFRAAILQSATATFTENTGNSAKSRGAVWKLLLKSLKCPEAGAEALECIRKKPATEIQDAAQNNRMSFTAVSGVKTWPARGRQRRLNSTEARSAIARVPVLVGSTADEGQTFLARSNNETAEDYLKGIAGNAVSDEIVDEILAYYPIGYPGIRSEWDQKARISGEYWFNTPAWGLANDSASVGIPAWNYLFNATYFEPPLYEGSGAFHASELQPLFGTYSRQNGTNGGKEHEAVSKAMQKAWADFAKNPYRGPGWEQTPVYGVFGFGNDGKQGFGTSKLEGFVLRLKFWLSLFDLMSKSQ
ncbi:hypothetical protein V2G26_019799 [Clonostachys chloroleuca]